MSRRKGSDNFNFNSFKANEGVKRPHDVFGADNQGQLSRPLHFERRFRPATNTKDFSLLSDYDYASLWARWRRGYELSMYTQQAYSGLVYSSFKYYVSGTAGVGGYIPGIFLHIQQKERICVCTSLEYAQEIHLTSLTLEFL